MRKTLPIWGSDMGMGHKSESVKRTGALTISLSSLYNVYLRYDSGRVISNCACLGRTRKPRSGACLEAVSEKVFPMRLRGLVSGRMKNVEKVHLGQLQPAPLFFYHPCCCWGGEIHRSCSWPWL